MSHSELNQLKRAEQLFDTGKLDEALEIFNDSRQYQGLNHHQKCHFQFLKGLILFYQNRGEEVLKVGEQILKEGQELNDNLQSLDGLFFIIIGLSIADKFKKTIKLVEKTEGLLELISDIPKNIYIRQETRIDVLKAFTNMFIGKRDLALKFLERPLSSQRELDNIFEVVWAHMIMSQIMIQTKARYDLAMEHSKKALTIAKNIKFNHYWIGFCYTSFGATNQSIHEYNLALKHYMKALAIFKEINNNWYVALLLNNIGNLYCSKGEYNLALKYLEEALLLWEQYTLRIEACLDNLIFVAIQKGDTERVQKYFDRLENIYTQKNGSHLEVIYQFNKALVLKSSSRIRDNAKAEELFKKIIKKKTLYFDITIYAYINLCDLLLDEFRLYNNTEVLDEINHNLSQLLILAEKSHSYLIFCETFILQAKLALINFNVEVARRFLTQAQKIAESYGIKRLAMKISYEHDELIKQLKIWEKLKESDAPLSERWKLAGLKNQMEKMVKKRKFDVPELSEEEPVLLLIISEGGIPFFSQSFMEDKSFEDHLFGGFFTAINTFINEIFSEGLDRASFGNYTLLMDSISPFLMCYIYKGQSYSAQNRIKSFIKDLKNNKELWDTFEKCYQMNKKIHIRDIPSLEPLIKEIFINKNIMSSES